MLQIWCQNKNKERCYSSEPGYLNGLANHWRLPKEIIIFGRKTWFCFLKNRFITFITSSCMDYTLLRNIQFVWFQLMPHVWPAQTHNFYPSFRRLRCTAIALQHYDFYHGCGFVDRSLSFAHPLFLSLSFPLNDGTHSAKAYFVCFAFPLQLHWLLHTRARPVPPDEAFAGFRSHQARIKTVAKCHHLPLTSARILNPLPRSDACGIIAQINATIIRSVRSRAHNRFVMHRVRCWYKYESFISLRLSCGVAAVGGGVDFAQAASHVPSTPQTDTTQRAADRKKKEIDYLFRSHRAAISMQ